MTGFYQDSIFWVEVDKIQPNPYQPRKEFNQEELQSLADSIRQYGVLQALVVTRTEYQKEDGGLAVQYELISGERRLRAAKLGGVKQVPVMIRTGEDSTQMKLELAIIENIQREELNVVDRARSFQKLSEEFNLSHAKIAQKVGKSREYITNNLRVLSLPDNILDDLSAGKLSEGHARPLMALKDKPEEQAVLHKEIMYKKMSVREAERVARKIAHENTRKKSANYNSEVASLEKEFSQSLGTRVHIEKRDQGGKLTIDYFSDEDLQQLLELFKQHGGSKSPTEMMEKFIASKQEKQQEKTQEQGQARENAKENVRESFEKGAAMHSTETPSQPQENQPGATAQDVADERSPVSGQAGEQTPDAPATGSVVSSPVIQPQSESESERSESVSSAQPDEPQPEPIASVSESARAQSPSGEESNKETGEHESVSADTNASNSFDGEDDFTPAVPEDDTTTDDDLYSVKNFTI